MAEYGLLIKNLNNRIVIDSKSPFLNYAEKGTINIVNADTLYTINITDTDAIPIVLFQPVTGGYVAIPSYDKSGSDITAAKIISDTAGLTVPWMCWRSELIHALPDYGVVVYNSLGSPVFSSGETGYIKVIGIYSLSNFGDFSSYYDLIVLNTNNYFGFFSPGILASVSSTQADIYTIGLKKINSTTLRYKPIHRYTNVAASSNTANSISAQFGISDYVIEVEPPPGV
jgi:hypothetical protein